MDVACVPTPHTAANVRSKYCEVLRSCGLNEDDIFKVVSDKTSTMKKVFSVKLWEDDEESETS